MKVFYITLITFISSVYTAQVISHFTWNSNPVTTAAIGPNAISVSGSAVSSTGGVGGTNGLNAGLPTADLNFTIPTGSGIFDVAGIDVSIDYQRDESMGNFFNRGSSLIITGAANLSVSYRVDNGVGGFNTVNSGNVYAIPNDNTFRTYRFVYLPTSGVGRLFVNGASVWSNDGPDNRGMYWTGAGNIVIGSALDGASQNQTFLDNLIIGAVTTFPLPIELLNFTATQQNNNTVKLEWETATEKNNDYFALERSEDALVWETFGTLKGAGISETRMKYEFTDRQPFQPTSYYRLKQNDFDGKFSFSPIRVVSITDPKSDDLEFYPNPCRNSITVSGKFLNAEELVLFNALGQKVISHYNFRVENKNRITIDLSSLPSGIYFLKTFRSVKRIIKE